MHSKSKVSSIKVDRNRGNLKISYSNTVEKIEVVAFVPVGKANTVV